MIVSQSQGKLIDLFNNHMGFDDLACCYFKLLLYKALEQILPNSGHPKFELNKSLEAKIFDKDREHDLLNAQKHLIVQDGFGNRTLFIDDEISLALCTESLGLGLHIYRAEETVIKDPISSQPQKCFNFSKSTYEPALNNSHGLSPLVFFIDYISKEESLNQPIHLLFFSEQVEKNILSP